MTAERATAILLVGVLAVAFVLAWWDERRMGR